MLSTKLMSIAAEIKDKAEAGMLTREAVQIAAEHIRGIAEQVGRLELTAGPQERGLESGWSALRVVQ